MTMYAFSKYLPGWEKKKNLVYYLANPNYINMHLLFLKLKDWKNFIEGL